MSVLNGPPPPIATAQARELARQGAFVQMRVLLAEARGHGMGFDAAWIVAWPHVRWDHDTKHRREAKAVLIEHREIWRSAYLREPAPASMVMVGRLAGMLADD